VLPKEETSKEREHKLNAITERGRDRGCVDLAEDGQESGKTEGSLSHSGSFCRLLTVQRQEMELEERFLLWLAS
jgi:hypothetical protein